MANDLQISGIKLPSPVAGHCPSTVVVDVINSGTDAAHLPVPMAVCLDIYTSSDGPAAAHYSVSTARESLPILPGAVLTFTFDGVEFPCGPTAYVTATADCRVTVPNNARSAPASTVFVNKIDAVPWLWAELRVGLQDSTGHITWRPDVLCPGGTCVAELSIRNAGCAAAVASVATLEMLDGAGQALGTAKLGTPAIAPGATTVLRFLSLLPTTAAGGVVMVKGCADSTAVVNPQCNLLHACAAITLPLASAVAAPQLSFNVTRPVFPGEPIPVSWRIRNGCGDIGKATARISFQGSVLYTSIAIPVGLQDVEKGEDVDLAVSAVVAPNLYKAGTAKLTLDITGTGTDPGPYTATALLTVVLEPVSGNWVFTSPAPGVPAAFPWKGNYNVAGRLSNPARAMMLPTSVVLDEMASVGAPAGRLANPPLGTIVPGAFGTALWSLIQTWSWLAPGVWTPIGPWFAGFTYTVTFAMQDAYGNAYPPATSGSTFVSVNVPASKIAFATVAKVCFGIGVGLVIAALLALAAVITIIGAAALFALAGVAFTIAAGFGLAALDPPVPDFNYTALVAVRLPDWPAELSSQPQLAPLLPVFALLARISEGVAVLSATEARLIAADIDRNADAARRQADEFRALSAAVALAARQIPLAGVEAIDGLRSRPLLQPLADAGVLNEHAQAWAKSGLPAKLRRHWKAGGLPEAQLRYVEQAVRSEGFIPRPIAPLLDELAQAIATIAQRVDDDALRVLAPTAA